MILKSHRRLSFFTFRHSNTGVNPKMRLYLFLALICSVANWAVQAADPTLYEFYTSSGIKSGLVSNNSAHFILNGKPLLIYAGAIHYFRNPPEYWQLILRQYRAAGLNTVQLYVPWNLHEDRPGHFDFESPTLNLARVLDEIKKADMFAIVRPGPYICAEWEFGGFPSWLLRDPNMQLRTNYQPYLERLKLYWEKVMHIILPRQFVEGGPVLMLQIENEYGGNLLKNVNPNPKSRAASEAYLRYLYKITRESGYHQQIFTSDNILYSKLNPIRGILPDVLETTNFGQDEEDLDEELVNMTRSAPDRPIYVSEYWTGWYDFWGGNHSNTSAVQLLQVAEKIILKHNGSVNFYPFIGGTNFGFTSGSVGDAYRRITTSYDYSAPLGEAHTYTKKYRLVRQLYHKLVHLGKLPRLALPDLPKVVPASAYGQFTLQEYLPLEAILRHSPRFDNVPKALPMELLNLGKDYGQRFGFVLYRVTGKPVAKYEITGPIQDRGILLVDGKEIAVILDQANFSINLLPSDYSPNSSKPQHIDMLVENLGRANFPYVLSKSRKGISSDILLDGVKATNLSIYSLDFNQTSVNALNALPFWLPYNGQSEAFPAMYRIELKLDANTEPRDTFLYLENWTKGYAFVNGFNIGRFWNIGPQKTLYIPAPLLKAGTNTIIILELHKPGNPIQFLDHNILG